jgi:hypothetical protein
MKHLLLASLALALSAGTASARRIPMPPPPPAPAPVSSPVSCRSAGMPLFTIRHASEVSPATATIRVYATGAWTASDGTRGRMTRGCLDRSDVKAIKSALRAADWDVTHMRIACFAYDPTFTEYAVRGHVMFRDQLCSGDVLDDNTRASLETIFAVLPKH